MTGPYDWRFDFDHDGKHDFFEEYERDDFDDMLAKRGYYAEEDDSSACDPDEDYEDDPDDFDDGFESDDF